MSAPWPTLSAPPALDIAPWGWNPTATFLTAYTTAQEEKRAQEKMAMEQELYRILLPEKIAKTEFNLKELAYASKMMEKSYRAQSADLDARYRAATSSGSNISGAAGGGAVQQGNVVSDPRNPLYHFQNRGAATPANAPTNQTPAPTGRKVKLTF